MKKPGKSGRKPRNLKASTMVGVRMSPDERARYQAVADREEMDLSTWLRAAASERAGMVEMQIAHRLIGSRE